jgi:hypothetical protein
MSVLTYYSVTCRIRTECRSNWKVNSMEVYITDAETTFSILKLCVYKSVLRLVVDVNSVHIKMKYPYIVYSQLAILV